MNIINIGMGELYISNSSSIVLVAPGLGSCVGLAMYDTEKRIGAMAHIVLPETLNNKNHGLPGKYANEAVPELINGMIKMGAKKDNIIVKFSGGAQMFTLEKGANILNIGVRNVIAVKKILQDEGLRTKNSDTGGNKGRTMRLDVATGCVFVKIIGQQELEL
jgi:chemotaxis protein CheD